MNKLRLALISGSALTATGLLNLYLDRPALALVGVASQNENRTTAQNDLPQSFGSNFPAIPNSDFDNGVGRAGE